jgi:ABC-type polysaccharide/polyol phosphate export permease
LGGFASFSNGKLELVEKKLTIDYDSANLPSPAIYELGELWRYRDLLRMLVSNSIKTRYKRSALGVVWTLLNPLLNTVVLTIAFSQLLRFNVKNYAVYLLTGLLVWNFFSQTTIHAMNTLVWGSSLIKRIYVPRTIFAVSVLGNGLVNFGLSLIPLALIMFVMRLNFSLTLLLIPVALLLLAMFTLGVTLVISTLAVFFVDVIDMYGILISAWFYITPIIYPIEIVPENFAFLLRLNPMYYLVSLFRSLIFDGVMPTPEFWLISIGLALSTLLLGWWVFTKKSDEFAYRI